MNDKKQVGANNSGFQQAESVDYSQAVKDSHIDMNPPHGEVEPLTGSSVLVEPKIQGGVPANGFPIGYGPNEHMKKIEKPKKPKITERMKHARKKITKKQKLLIILIPLFTVIIISGIIIYASVTGAFKTDYSGTYSTAKELRVEMQKLRSDASCSRVTEYVNNEYTTMETYQGYVENCRKIGQGVEIEILEKIGNTAGVLKDEEVRQRYETLKRALEVAKEGNEKVDGVLKYYTIWHGWLLAEEEGNDKHSDWDWSETDITSATKNLLKSGSEDFKKYAEGWAEKKLAAAVAYNNYYRRTDSSIPVAELYTALELAKKEFEDFKKENEPDILELYPLELVDTAKLYAKFEEFYDYVRETYQNNYNFDAGGCKEMVNSIVCD